MAVSDLTPAERAYTERLRKDIEANKAARMAAEAAAASKAAEVAAAAKRIPVTLKGGKVPALGGFVGILLQVLLMVGIGWYTNKSNPTPPPEAHGLDDTLKAIQTVKAISEVMRPAVSTEVAAKPEKAPTAAETLNDAVNKPTALFGIAAIGFVTVFVFSQARAGFHEVTETTKDLYTEGGRATKVLANADRTTSNISRRRKG